MDERLRRGDMVGVRGRPGKVIIIIIIHNTYVAPSPTRLAQSASQFETRMNIGIST